MVEQKVTLLSCCKDCDQDRGAGLTNTNVKVTSQKLMGGAEGRKNNFSSDLAENVK